MEKTTAITALAALAHDSRLAIFRALVQAGEPGLAAGSIASRLALPAATLSFHLTHLKQAGLITCQRHGRSLIYHADYPAMTALLGYLTENCCQGNASCAPIPCCPPTPTTTGTTTTGTTGHV